MSDEQLRRALSELGLSVDDLAHLTGARVERVREWLHGDERIPDWMPPFLAGLTVPAARSKMEAAADHFATSEATGAWV